MIVTQSSTEKTQRHTEKDKIDALTFSTAPIKGGEFMEKSRDG